MANAVEALTNALKAHLATISGLKVYSEFPTANQKLALPALTIFRGAPDYDNLDPYFLSKTDPDVDNKIFVKYIVGQYDLRMQLDLWTGNKKERETLFESVFQKLNPDIIPMGLSLKLTDYHDIWARYDLVGHEFMDDEASAQRQEWRVRLELLAHVKAVLVKEEYAIITIENQLTTPDNI